MVGLAIARQLANRQNTSTVLFEKHGFVGQETSSRNSEVFHKHQPRRPLLPAKLLLTLFRSFMPDSTMAPVPSKLSSALKENK